MGLFKLLYHGKEMDELEEILKMLFDRIKSNYGRTPDKHFSGKNQINRLYLSQEYGYGEFVDPRTDISFSNNILDQINASSTMRRCAERIFIMKRSDYNAFNEMCAEFTHKANRYIQLLDKTGQAMPLSIQNIIRNYQGVAANFYYSYKYVVE